MGKSIKIEIIYFSQDSDIQLEFGLHGNYPLRLLTCHCSDNKTFISLLKKATLRSAVIIVVGGFLKPPIITDLLGTAIGRPCKEIDYTKFGLSNETSIFLPDTALPLITSNGILGGCILESGPQSIIMLSEDKIARLQIVKELVLGYIEDRYAFFSSENFHDDSPVQQPEETSHTADQDSPIAEDCKQETLDNQSLDILSPSDQLNDNLKPNLTDGQAYPQDENPHKEVLYGTVLNPVIFGEDDSDSCQKPNKKYLFLKIVSIILAFLIVVGSAYIVYSKWWKPNTANVLYSRIVDIYNKGTADLLSTDISQRYSELKNINPDIAGWINISETNINYPFVSLSSEKNAEYYRNHIFDGTQNEYGTPYCVSASKEKEFYRNTVIYGNDLNNGKIFSDLKNFTNQNFIDKNPVIIVDSLYREANWDIFSVFTYTNEAPMNINQTEFDNDLLYYDYISSLLNLSMFDFGIEEIGAKDPIIVLVSLGAQNTVVAAKLKAKPETVQANTSETASNDNLIEVDANTKLETTSPPSEKKKILVIGKDDKDIVLVDNKNDPANMQTIVKPSDSFDLPQSTKPNSSSNSSNISVPSQSSTSTPPSSNEVILTVTNNKTVISGPASEILARIVEAEMGSGYPIEALKAQTIATYSYLIYMGAASGKSPSVPMKEPGQRVKNAVESVLGIRAVYNGSTAQTFYYAISAGHTANVQDVWNDTRAYLKSVDSSVDQSVSGFSSSFEISSSEMEKIIRSKISLSVDISSINKNDWFLQEFDQNGLYCTYITIGKQKQIKGMRLYEGSWFNTKLRSNAYIITYNAATDSFVFTVKGYGHGVGMSQTGARAYARDYGWTYKQILTHYYSGIVLV